MIDTGYIREKILDLAVRGELVDQDPLEGDARDLLAEIKAEKEELIKAKKIRKEKALAEIREDEIPFEIPESWVWVRLGELSNLINGDRSNNYPNKNDLVNEGIPFFGAADLGLKYLSTEEVRYISQEKFDSLRSGHLEDGDLVTLLRGSVGKTAIFKKSNQYTTGFINAQMVIIRFIEKNPVHSNFYYYVLCSPFFVRFFDMYKSGTAVSQIPAKTLNQLEVPLPPLAEQERIVERIEEAFDLLDEIEKSQFDLISLADQLKSKVLENAFLGQLVNQNEENRDTELYLKEISRNAEILSNENNVKYVVKEPRLSIHNQEYFKNIPSSWILTSISTISVNYDKFRKPINKNDRARRILGKNQDELFPYFGSTGLAGYIDDYMLEERALLVGEDAAPFLDKSQPKSYIVDGKYWVNNHAHILKPLINEVYLKYYLDIFDYRGYVSGTTRLKLTQSNLQEIPIPLPPLEEQKRIVGKIEQIFQLIDLVIKQ